MGAVALRKRASERPQADPADPAAAPRRVVNGLPRRPDDPVEADSSGRTFGSAFERLTGQRSGETTGDVTSAGDPDAARRDEEEKARKRAGSGRASTMLVGASGADGVSAKRTLLGAGY